MAYVLRISCRKLHIGLVSKGLKPLGEAGSASQVGDFVVIGDTGKMLSVGARTAFQTTVKAASGGNVVRFASVVSPAVAESGQSFTQMDTNVTTEGKLDLSKVDQWFVPDVKLPDGRDGFVYRGRMYPREWLGEAIENDVPALIKKWTAEGKWDVKGNHPKLFQKSTIERRHMWNVWNQALLTDDTPAFARHPWWKGIYRVQIFLILATIVNCTLMIVSILTKKEWYDAVGLSKLVDFK